MDDTGKNFHQCDGAWNFHKSRFFFLWLQDWVYIIQRTANWYWIINTGKQKGRPSCFSTVFVIRAGRAGLLYYRNRSIFIDNSLEDSIGELHILALPLLHHCAFHSRPPEAFNLRWFRYSPIVSVIFYGPICQLRLQQYSAPILEAIRDVFSITSSPALYFLTHGVIPLAAFILSRGIDLFI